jgi:hypothetical protein
MNGLVQGTVSRFYRSSKKTGLVIVGVMVPDRGVLTIGEFVMGADRGVVMGVVEGGNEVMVGYGDRLIIL